MIGVGIHDSIPADQYHADPCEQPSLSSSIVKKLLTQSPAHAKAAHPRLQDIDELCDEVHKASFDLGTVAHSLYLEGDADVVVVDAPDWRTKDAQTQRQAAYDAGGTPLLRKEWERVQAMVDQTRRQLDRVHAWPPLIDDGKAEQTIVWDDDGVLCRARLDWLRDDREAIDDLKTTAASASPRAWTRTMLGFGGDIQAAFYLRGLRALTGTDAEFRFVVQETAPPYALSVVSPSPLMLERANDKIDEALATWRQCIATGVWPGYSTGVSELELPSWAVAA